MKNSIYFILLVALVGCSPTRYLKRAKAFITMVPPIEIISHSPNPDPSTMDPMYYYDYFANTISNALNEKGLNTIVDFPGMERNSSEPNHLSIEIGMVHIEDLRMMGMVPNALPAENPGQNMIKLTLIGGFSSVDKKGNSISEGTNIQLEMGAETIAQMFEKDPNTDALKQLLNTAAKDYSEEIMPLILKHLKANG
ncbi:MAG: hypothetical protein JXQ87_18460 [Bacteroidia bacterium]